MGRRGDAVIRVTRDGRKLVRLELAFLAFLSLTIWATREIRGIL